MANARRLMMDHRTQRHAVALPPSHQWDNRQVAAALLASTSLTYGTIPAGLSDFLDRIAQALVGEAARRLEAMP
jgi:hypothetical protein